MYCNSTDASYDLAEDEDFNSEMGNLMDADIGSQVGIFDKFHQGYASERHMGESSSALTRAPTSTYDFDDGIPEPCHVCCFDFDGSIKYAKKEMVWSTKKNSGQTPEWKEKWWSQPGWTIYLSFFPDI